MALQKNQINVSFSLITSLFVKRDRPKTMAEDVFVWLNPIYLHVGNSLKTSDFVLWYNKLEFSAIHWDTLNN